MASSIDLVILFLWTLHCGGTFEVQQESLIQTAFANEEVNTTCKAIFNYQNENKNFEIIYYRINQINPGGDKIRVHTSKCSEKNARNQNQTVTTICNIAIKPIEHASTNGVYYCRAYWKNTGKKVMGMGTFILFRDRGYTEPPLTLWMFLITLTFVLAVVVCLRKKEVGKRPAQEPEPQYPASLSKIPGSLYAALGPQAPDIYTVIEDKSSEEEKPTPQVPYQKRQEEIYDNVYENF
ncbi:NFAT activation molecule 1 isoform X2 [Paroedura picta]|uniref:NFAT activation molecule 1 isoform X2 n=1 Tax=Paroedura picta TaxID=143630 RepID=UPI0010156F5F